MTVNICFQAADNNMQRNPNGNGAYDRGFNVTAAGFDLDFGALTIYPRGQEMDENLTLAVQAGYMNEDAEECGLVGWRIAPDTHLLALYPEIQQWIGRHYGRVIVTVCR